MLPCARAELTPSLMLRALHFLQLLDPRPRAQGLNFLASFALHVLRDEAAAFGALLFLSQTAGLFSHDLTPLRAELSTLRVLVDARLPALSARLLALGLPIEAVATRWLLCCGLGAFRPQAAAALWDALFFEEWVASGGALCTLHAACLCLLGSRAAVALGTAASSTSGGGHCGGHEFEVAQALSNAGDDFDGRRLLDGLYRTFPGSQRRPPGERPEDVGSGQAGAAPAELCSGAHLPPFASAEVCGCRCAPEPLGGLRPPLCPVALARLRAEAPPPPPFALCARGVPGCADTARGAQAQQPQHLQQPQAGGRAAAVAAGDALRVALGSGRARAAAPPQQSHASPPRAHHARAHSARHGGGGGGRLGGMTAGAHESPAGPPTATRIAPDAAFSPLADPPAHSPDGKENRREAMERARRGEVGAALRRLPRARKRLAVTDVVTEDGHADAGIRDGTPAALGGETLAAGSAPLQLLLGGAAQPNAEGAAQPSAAAATGMGTGQADAAVLPQSAAAAMGSLSVCLSVCIVEDYLSRVVANSSGGLAGTRNGVQEGLQRAQQLPHNRWRHPHPDERAAHLAKTAAAIAALEASGREAGGDGGGEERPREPPLAPSVPRYRCVR